MKNFLKNLFFEGGWYFRFWLYSDVFLSIAIVFILLMPKDILDTRSQYEKLVNEFQNREKRAPSEIESLDLKKQAKIKAHENGIFLRRCKYARDPSSYFFSENDPIGRFMNDFIQGFLLVGFINVVIWLFYFLTGKLPFLLFRMLHK